jgi:hypothetical protein
LGWNGLSYFFIQSFVHLLFLYLIITSSDIVRRIVIFHRVSRWYGSFSLVSNFFNENLGTNAQNFGFLIPLDTQLKWAFLTMILWFSWSFLCNSLVLSCMFCSYLNWFVVPVWNSFWRKNFLGIYSTKCRVILFGGRDLTELK